MRPTFYKSHCGKVSSVLSAPREGQSSAFVCGQSIVFKRMVDLSPHGYIEEGAKAMVGHVDEAQGMVELCMLEFYRGLSDWGNSLWLIPFETDEILESLRIVENELVEG